MLSTSHANGNTDSKNGRAKNHLNNELTSFKASNFLSNPTKRVEISQFVKNFQKILDKEWDTYQIAVSLFIVGKMSREELMIEIAPVLAKRDTRRMHNQLLMSMLANCYKDEPLDGMSTSIFGNSSKKKILGNKSSQYEQLKRDILSLSVRERVRIKGITKESGKRGRGQNVLVLSRQAMVPKVPIVTTRSEDDANGDNKVNRQLQSTLMSVNDIIRMVNEPLCTESYELPERGRMKNIMLGLARENGLLGGVSMKAVDVLYHGLQYHLKSILGCILDNVRAKCDDRQPNISEAANRNIDINKSKNKNKNKNSESGCNVAEPSVTETTGKKKSITITAEDVFDAFSLIPHMIQPYGTIDYLTDLKLKNDDDYDLVSREILQAVGKGSNSLNNTKISEEIKFTNGEPDDVDFENYTYIIPNKMSEVSYMLKAHEKAKESTKESVDGTPKINLALSDKDIGTGDELNWIINDLLAEDI